MKKRILAMILAFCLLVTSIPLSTMSVFAAGTKYGDADDNNKVDLQDLVLMERYVNGEEKLTINKDNSDVNADGAVDKTDIELLREYLAGNLTTLTPVLCTISFNTNGGDTIDSIKTGKGYTRKGVIPTATKKDSVFVRWELENGDAYYQSDYVINTNITLTAVYETVESKQMLDISSFSLNNQKTNVSFLITGDFSDVNVVTENLTILSKDGSDPVEIKVKTRNDIGKNVFEVYAPNGFNEGSTYELTLKDNLSFVDKDKMYRTVYFDIEKEENDNLKFNPDMVFIKDTEEMKYTIDGDTDNVQEVLQSALLDNSEDQKAIEGTFNMSGGGLSAGDIACIYETTRPDQRDYTKNDYENDALAYIRIKSVSGNTYTFESLNEDDMDDVLAMPDTIAYQVSTLPTANGKVKKNDYDTYARTMLGKQNAPEFEIYDFLVFYTEDFNKLTSNSNVVYGQITNVNGDDVSYKIVTKDYIENFTGMYVVESVEADPILADIQQDKILKDIKKQAEDSGFIEQAGKEMMKSAFQTKEIQNQLRNNGVTDKDINVLMKSTPNVFAAEGGTDGGTTGGTGSKTEVVVEGVSVIPSFIKGGHFKEGIGVNLDICLTISINTKTTSSKTSSLKIELMAGFQQELALDFSVNIDNDLTWYLIFPNCNYFNVSVSVDVQNYTSVSVGAKMYTVSDDITSASWSKLSETVNGSTDLREKIRKINALGVKAKKLQAMGEDASNLLDEVQGYIDELPTVEVDNVTYSFAKLEEVLGAQDISAEFNDVFSAKDEAQAKTGLDQLMTKYQDMLNQECDWVELFNKEIFKKSIYVKLVEINIGVNFIVQGNVNLSIGADIEYEVGKRYCFWVDIVGKTSGSSEIDLIDERFGFQFYVMGTLGLKAGIKAEIAVGIISTRIASVGANVEFGIYLRLWGYFVYYFEDLRPVNSDRWNETEEMLGALYLEFGLYLKVKFKAQAFDNAFKYEPTLYDAEFPLVTAGVKQNIYDFNEHPESKDILYIKDNDSDSRNGVTMELPSKYRNMQTIDLCSGDKIQQIYPLDKYIITFSDSRFSIDNNGVINVKVPADARYMKCDMRIVWKSDKVAFSKYDTDITVPILWTNMTEDEQTEKFTASVAVGNMLDGYKVVWSDKFTRLDSFNLPKTEEILKLINYDSYNYNNSNVKYNDDYGYNDSSENLSITADTTYYFNITPKTYELTVNGIQKPDGTTYSKTFNTKFGNSFDLKELQSTGKNISEKSEYTIFKDVTTDNGNVFDPLGTVDLKYVQNYGTKVTATANYTDDSLTATFNFVGLGADVQPKEIKFKKGTTPYYADIINDVKSYGGDGAKIDEIYPALAPSESSVSYTVKCSISSPEPSYTLTFNRNYNANDNVVIANQKYPKGSPIMYPSQLNREGYTFEGWYTDRKCENYFSTNEKMPGSNITLYAKWSANSYNLSFKSNYGKVPEDRSILFGSQYSDLTTLSDENFKFLGWFTQEVGGTQIQSGDKFTLASNQTLYAHWGDKTDLYDCINSKATTTVDYNSTAQNYAIQFLKNSDAKDLIAIQYKKQNTSEWSYSAPINAGVYDIKLTKKSYSANISELYNKYKLSQEITINSGLTINKINLPEISIPSAFTTGGAVSIGRPDGIKGDGAVNYAIYTYQTGIRRLVSKSTNGFISNLNGGTYYACVEVDEGTNYKARNSAEKEIYVNGKKDGNYQANIQINTTNGTDSTIYSGLYTYYSGDKYSQVTLDSSENDFEEGLTQTFVLGNNVTPWEITGAYLIKPANKFTWDTWSFTSSIFMTNGSNTVSRQFASGENIDEKTYQLSLNFKRNIANVGNFYTAGNREIDLASNNKYTFNYNSLVTDNYMADYNPMEYYGAPKFSVSSGNDVYDRFIKYTGLTSFEIDTVAMAEYIKTFGGTAPIFVVSLRFPSETVINNDNGNYEFPIYAKNAPNQTNLTSVNSTKSVKRVSMMKSVSSQNNAQLTLTAKDISKLESDTFEIPVMLENNPSIWGVLANVNYDHEAFELLGCSAGNIFDEDMFTMKKDLSASPFTFLATKKTLENTSSNGTLVTLRFKVKSGATQKNHEIAINLLQCVNALGEIQESTTNNSTVVLDNTNPTGVITIGTNTWNNILNNITFGLFFNKTQSVTISAEDKQSGVKSVEYYVSNSEIKNVNHIKENDWKKYENSFNIDPNNNYVIYAKITDNADNSTIINTNGLVVDNILPVIGGIEDGKNYYQDVDFTFSDNNLDSICVDNRNVDISNGSYTITADNKQHTIVATDKAGNKTTYTIGVYKTYSVTLNAGDGYTFEPQNGSKSSVNYDGNYSFKVIIHKNYECKNNFAVKVNGIVITADVNGVYKIKNIKVNQNVTVEGLVLKSADYTAVDKAIEKASSLKADDYDNFDAVTDAIKAVVRNKNITEQDEVNAYADAIDKAVKGLKKKTEKNNSPQTGDNFNIITWLSLLFVSGGIAVLITENKKRKNKHSK